MGTQAKPTRTLNTVAATLAAAFLTGVVTLAAQAADGLWAIYDKSLKTAKYIDLTHAITPTMPVWAGFGQPVFGRAKAAIPAPPFAQQGETFTYGHAGFEAGTYALPTDQLGTQLDPPAHWAPDYPAIDELPATYTLRPLVVIPIQDKVAHDPGYQLQVDDISAFEAEHGPIPEGAVVFIRSDWSKCWPDPALTRQEHFPGVSLAALQFLHLQRHILFHGHEPLDTDDTPRLEGEYWLMHHGYAQAEGLTHLDLVAPTGYLVAIGYAKFKGGTGGYARYIAICPTDWPFGTTIDQTAGPLPRSDHPLHWDAHAGMRVR